MTRDDIREEILTLLQMSGKCGIITDELVDYLWSRCHDMSKLKEVDSILEELVLDGEIRNESGTYFFNIRNVYEKRIFFALIKIKVSGTEGVTKALICEEFRQRGIQPSKPQFENLISDLIRKHDIVFYKEKFYHHVFAPNIDDIIFNLIKENPLCDYNWLFKTLNEKIGRYNDKEISISLAKLISNKKISVNEERYFVSTAAERRIKMAEEQKSVQDISRREYLENAKLDLRKKIIEIDQELEVINKPRVILAQIMHDHLSRHKVSIAESDFEKNPQIAMVWLARADRLLKFLEDKEIRMSIQEVIDLVKVMALQEL